MPGPQQVVRKQINGVWRDGCSIAFSQDNEGKFGYKKNIVHAGTQVGKEDSMMDQDQVS